jgi:hypothetical protein
MPDTGIMSDTDSVHLDTDEHDHHASGHGHEPAGTPLGPVDVTTWAYAIVGSIAGLLVALVLWVAGGS